MSNLERRPPAAELGGLAATAARPVLDVLPTVTRWAATSAPTGSPPP
jgi:hypothetical protein